MPVTLQDVKNAAEIIKGAVHRTHLDANRTFSALTGADIYLKLENLQKTGSFKIRGAYNKINSLTEEERKKGVIAASAGNHAQGVAYAASLMGIKATIVMPENAPLAKIVATKSYGAEVVLSGNGYDDAFEKAKSLEREHGQTFIHGFDDAAIIAGQGTIGLEILQDLHDADAVVVPIGGGGLAAGIAVAVKETSPKTKVYGVQAKGANAMYMSNKSRTLCKTEEAKTFADGIAIKNPGAMNFALLEKYVDDIVLVDDENTANTILMLLERSKIMVEGAGAVSLTAVLDNKIPCRGKIVTIVSGGNVDINFISQIIERGLVKAGRRVRLAAGIPDRPGNLRNMLSVIAGLQANVLQVAHSRIERHVPLGQVFVEVQLETRDALHTEELLTVLKHKGYHVEHL
jgi:threonine dehydratase